MNKETTDMSKNKDARIADLVITLSRIRQEQPAEYTPKIQRYHDMRNGSDGGPWREGAGMSLRELHYSDWRDEDFQNVLERLDETPIMDEHSRVMFFEHERGIWNKLKKFIGPY
jgi:hypothetical protein